MTNAVSQSEAADEMLILLDETPANDLGIRAVELSLNAVNVRFTASELHGLEEVFRHEVASILRSICDGAGHSLGKIDRPDFCLRLRGLTLEGCRISVSVGESGLRRFRLRIMQATGNAMAAFRHSTRGDTGLALFTPRILSGPEDALTAERLFDEMLSQLYLPLVNLNAYLRHVLDGSIPGRGQSLADSVVQLKTRAETLQFAFDRLIAEMMVDKYTQTPPRRPALPERTAA